VSQSCEPLKAKPVPEVRLDVRALYGDSFWNHKFFPVNWKARKDDVFLSRISAKFAGKGMNLSPDNAAANVLCPSAQPEMAGSFVFGVVVGTVDAPRAVPLAEPQPVTAELLALSAPIKPTEIFRFAAFCAGDACKHFDGARCRLVGRIVNELAPVTASLPFCRLRPHCRWWLQEGKAACMRCPQIVTEQCSPSELMSHVAYAEV